LTLAWHCKIPRTRMDRDLIVIDKLSETIDPIPYKGDNINHASNYLQRESLLRCQ